MKKGDVQTVEAVAADGTVTTYELTLREIEVKKTDNPESGANTSKSKKGKTATDSAKRSRPAERRARKRQAKARKRQEHKRGKQTARVLESIGF
jgi:hypothetical protein